MRTLLPSAASRRTASRRSWPRALRALSLAVVTPLLEKNALKTLSPDVPMVFSMSRVVVLAFAVGMLRQIWHAGVAGWPEATLAIAVVLAMPVLGAMERVAPEQVVELAKCLVGRFGIGETRKVASVYESREPSRYDDHRSD
jgi:peptidoglycan/LPS O-acetylase OafA/YrhL